MTPISPPFRAEHIGSLLRPAALLEERRRFARGEINRDQLTTAEDRAIAEAVGLQKRLGLKLATDGEFRRQSYHTFFYEQLGDVSLDNRPENSAEGRGAQPQFQIGSRLKWARPIHVEDFLQLQAQTDALPKITIPGPCALHFRGGDAAILATAYRDLDQFWDDIVAAFGAELNALYEAGCRDVQIDETAFAKFGDPDVQATLSARGEDWRAVIDLYIAVTNRVLRAAPSQMRIGMHLCRGNRAGLWHSQGSYDAVADKLFNALDIGFYFLEYDTPRAGTFTPLRLVPKDKAVVLGLVSTKTMEPEDRDALKRRVEEASRLVDLDRLALSPQCGFASTDIGNPITPETQEAKLRLVVDLARKIWGEG